MGSLFDDMFSESLMRERRGLWKVLCSSFFQRYIDPTDTVLDLGAGFCEFINHIECGKKVAVDIHEHPKRFADPNVEVLIGRGNALSKLLNGEDVDAVFLSNFLEHMRDKEELKDTLEEIRKVLKPGGKLLILQPNIRYGYKLYWDFFDHHIPLSHKSLEEILRYVGFEIVEMRPRFLPWTTKSRLPKKPFLVKLYLKLPPLHLLMGKQMFVFARKGETSGNTLLLGTRGTD
jgi:SAM-dependent methyltransferase